MILILLLAILLGSYALLTAIDRLRGARIDSGLRGRMSLALLLLFTGVGHFITTQQMAEMLPAWVPGRVGIVYVTGILELAGALGLLIPRLSRLAGVCLLLFLICVFPANVFAAVKSVQMGGHEAGPIYLLVRGPFQLLLIWWVYHFAVRSASQRESRKP